MKQLLVREVRYRHRRNDLSTHSSKTNYERMTRQLTIWLKIIDCLTVTIEGSKRTNDITSLHGQQHHGLTDRRPITPRLNWQIRSISRVLYHQLTRLIQLTLKMTTAQVVETSVIDNNNSPIQDCVHPDDHTYPTYEMTAGLKPFTVMTTWLTTNSFHS